MVLNHKYLLSCHGLVWVGCALALWAAPAGSTAATRYDAATPHTPPYNRYKYIPINPNTGSYQDDSIEDDSSSVTTGTSTSMAPSEFILTALRTLLDVVRNFNKERAQKTKAPALATNTDVAIRRTRRDNVEGASGRGFDDYYDEHDHDTTTTTTPKPMKQGRYTDPWAGYYDWIINEGSFKFWSVFQLFTAALLLYACFSAIYYAKFNPIIPDYDREYDDYFLERSIGRSTRSLESWELPSGLNWINPRTFQFILDAISKHYKEE